MIAYRRFQFISASLEGDETRVNLHGARGCNAYEDESDMLRAKLEALLASDGERPIATRAIKARLG